MSKQTLHPVSSTLTQSGCWTGRFSGGSQRASLFWKLTCSPPPKPTSTHLRVMGPDPGSIAVDAFQQNWNRWKSFIHPPVVLLSRIIQKVRQDEATTLLVAPNWPGQPWYPELRQMLIDHPLLLPIQESLPTQVDGMISGNTTKQRAFHLKLSRFSSRHGLNQPRRGTVAHGELGLIGALVIDNVRFKHL